ncbi:MAG: DMT family transporter [Deltaproteobacteria bacterium]|nr:DMT family transporter [Deltaproteobacteria bacterium]
MKKIFKTKTEMPLSAILTAAFVCVLFGGNATAIKISLEGFGIFASSGFRLLFAGAFLFLWGKLTGKNFKIKKINIKRITIITLIFVVQFSCYALGVSKNDASRAALLINLQPFFVLILSHIFIADDKINLKKLLGMIIGFCGVSLLIIKKEIGIDFEPGDLLVLCAALLWAANAVYIKTFIKNFSVFNLTFYQVIFSAPILFIESFIFDDTMISLINFRTCAAIFYQAVICTAFGFIAWNFLLKKYKASLLHSFLFITPVSGVFFGALLLNEALTFNIIGAMCLIAVGIIIAQYNPKKITDI